ncbi:hypothetical protein [Sinorhizobium medicae]|uniref:hypothetical protein n=1 Tax=Sinorhizobium medicae TaxID=110321 RepID=UPI002AF6B498|nr:hypothetical protein [Sinorhizobium medicae]WQO64499.1 hypothetical protein U8C40_15310 [Sinorhizobium medicae]WQO71598.1 hypothetical protein U8C31_15045 [Sinorhizobium medicae]
MTTTECVVEILVVRGQYRELSTPFRVGSQDFVFTHILAGTIKANDLVLVIELTSATANDVIIRSVLAFTRALDVIGSRRPVTVILTSGQADKDLVNAINRVCRVLPIGAPTGDDASQVIADWLAALLPLESPPPVSHLGDWRGALKAKLEQLDAAEVAEVMLQAQNGKEAVEEALAAQIAARADTALEEGEETI